MKSTVKCPIAGQSFTGADSESSSNSPFRFVCVAVEEAVRIITGGAPELAVEGNGPVESNAVLAKAVKRPNEDSDEDEEKGAVVPPVHDIYRARQQKRIR